MTDTRPYHRHASLAVERPDVAAQWHPRRNGEVTPFDVSACSNRQVWWLDEFDHEWRTTVASRVVASTLCPVCAGRVRGRGNLLIVAAPQIAAQWHPTLNTVNIETVTLGSKYRAWWLHGGRVWQAFVYNRTRGIRPVQNMTESASYITDERMSHVSRSGSHHSE